MIGLCFGLAVKAHASIKQVRSNRDQFVFYSRTAAMSFQRGESYRYYKLLDACPLRMS